MDHRLVRTTVLAALLLVPAVRAEPSPVQDLRIVHVTVVSPERDAPLRNTDVTLHDGRISALGAHASHAGSKVLDGRDLFLIPGLIDSHVHLGAIPGMTDEQEATHPDIAREARAQIPRSYLHFGFTTLIDLISTPAAMARWRSHDPAPDTWFCGGAALMDGYPMNYAPKPGRYAAWPYMLIEAGMTAPPGIEPSEHTPEAVVARMKADGAICVKTFFERGFGGVHDLPVPRPETIRALVRAAHAAGLPVLMHANSAEAQTFGLDTGVDILAHGLWNVDESAAPGELTPAVRSILDLVADRQVGWQPTLEVLYGLKELFDPAFLADPRLARALPRSLIGWYASPEGQWFHDVIAAGIAGSAANVRTVTAPPGFLAVPIGRVAAATGYLAKRNARLLFGTDTPSAPTYANPPGLNGQMEMQRWVAAGVTPAQIFQAATRANARAFKLDGELGTVEVGKRANLLLVRADPRRSIDAYSGIVRVILDGRVLDPAMLAADRMQ